MREEPVGENGAEAGGKAQAPAGRHDLRGTEGPRARGGGREGVPARGGGVHREANQVPPRGMRKDVFRMNTRPHHLSYIREQINLKSTSFWIYLMDKLNKFVYQF